MVISFLGNGSFLEQTINLASVIAIEILMVMILGLVRIRIKDKIMGSTPNLPHQKRYFSPTSFYSFYETFGNLLTSHLLLNLLQQFPVDLGLKKKFHSTH